MATNSYPNATAFLRDLLNTTPTDADAIQAAEWRHVRITRPEGHAEVEGLFLVGGDGQPYFLTLDGKNGVRIEVAGYTDLTFLDEDDEQPTDEVAAPQQP